MLWTTMMPFSENLQIVQFMWNGCNIKKNRIIEKKETRHFFLQTIFKRSMGRILYRLCRFKSCQSRQYLLLTHWLSGQISFIQDWLSGQISFIWMIGNWFWKLILDDWKLIWLESQSWMKLFGQKVSLGWNWFGQKVSFYNFYYSFWENLCYVFQWGQILPSICQNSRRK